MTVVTVGVQLVLRVDLDPAAYRKKGEETIALLLRPEPRRAFVAGIRIQLKWQRFGKLPT